LQPAAGSETMRQLRRVRMISKLFALLGFGGADYDGKLLAKDARALINMIQGQHGAAQLARIAEECRVHIDQVHERGLNDPQFYAQGVNHLTDLNRAARSRHDNVAWSGITLAIIYIKAEILGEPGVTAINTVKGFTDKWVHVSDSDASENDC